MSCLILIKAIEGVISEFFNYLAECLKGQFWAPEIMYLYPTMLPIGSIMRHHYMYFHIYADTTQLCLLICLILM